jgi:predicted hotdog family 3-hydroxylacyl-ACP dehydratase
MADAIETLLPHHPPMRWLESLDACTDETASATVCFTPGHFAVADGVVLETALVECMAQTVAAAATNRARTKGVSPPSGTGVLAAVSDFRIHAPAPLDRPVQIEVRQLTRLDRMVLVSGRISSDGQVIATGNLKLYA